MADLESLVKRSISQMTDDELTERLREIRLARRTPAVPQKSKKQKGKSTTIISSSSLIDKLSADQVAMLLEKLGGSTNLDLTTTEEEQLDDGSDEDAGETEDCQD